MTAFSAQRTRRRPETQERVDIGNSHKLRYFYTIGRTPRRTRTKSVKSQQTFERAGPHPSIHRVVRTSARCIPTNPAETPTTPRSPNYATDTPPPPQSPSLRPPPQFLTPIPLAAFSLTLAGGSTYTPPPKWRLLPSSPMSERTIHGARAHGRSACESHTPHHHTCATTAPEMLTAAACGPRLR